jgi:benzoate/toluate 1,2-dioxygenase reductase subunit
VPKVELRYSDGTLREIDAEPFETVYQAAARSDAAVLTDCLEGACATCKARCLSGEYDLIDPSFDALSQHEQTSGHVLLCQMEALTDCVVEMPYSFAFATQTGPNEVQTKVFAIDWLGEHVAKLVLEAPGPLVFSPGQYAQLAVPGTDQHRPYSFANPSGESHVTFYVRLLDDGVMGHYLKDQVQVGDAMTMRSPLGSFYMRPGTGPIVMIAGGTGVAPMLSMLHALAQSTAKRSVHLFHGARVPQEFFAAGPLTQLRDAGMDVTYVQSVDELGGAQRLPEGIVHGRVTDAVPHDLLRVEASDVYLCGPPAMVAASERLLGELGVPTPRIFSERFNPA